MSETRKPTPEIIDTVPGVQRVAPVETPVQHGQVIRDVDFKGDPRRVIGFPGNPNARSFAAYGEFLKHQSSENDLGGTALATEVEITQVPGVSEQIEVRHEQPQA